MDKSGMLQATHVEAMSNKKAFRPGLVGLWPERK
jgi:hypothetical protein